MDPKPIWIYDDGGRAASGYKGSANDCVIRAIAIAAELPYRSVVDMVRSFAREERLTFKRPFRSSMRHGVRNRTTQRIMTELGWNWFPRMRVGSGCKVHLKADELPDGRLVVQVSRHVTAVVYGVNYDTFDPSRDGTRAVYGYWSKPTF